MVENYIGMEVEAKKDGMTVIVKVEKELFDINRKLLYLWGKDRKGVPTRIILTRSDIL